MLNQQEKYRQRIADGVRRLRAERRWTQAELAQRLGLSQSRLSEIERGAGSFTAEQLLTLLRIFNVGIRQFVREGPLDAEDELQSALARLGARHLYESENVLPSERLEEVTDVTHEAILVGTPRLITSLGPVLVQHVDRVSLGKLNTRLETAGLERRLGWLIENLGAAVELQSRTPLPRATALQYRRAKVVWDEFLEHARARLRTRDPGPADLLDAGIRSKQTQRLIADSSSEISQQWGIVTSLQPRDFADALEASRVGA